MQLPRRVPWASPSELEQLCSWIYSDETDLHSKRLAVNKVSPPLFFFIRPFKSPIKPRKLTRTLLSIVICVEIYNAAITRPRIHARTLVRDSTRRFGVTTSFIRTVVRV